MKRREHTLKALIKSMRMMGDKIAPECADALSLIENDLSSLRDAVYGDVFKQATSDLFFAANDLSSIRSEAKRDGFITRREMEEAVSLGNWLLLGFCFVSAIIGGIIAMLVVQYG